MTGRLVLFILILLFVVGLLGAASLSSEQPSPLRPRVASPSSSVAKSISPSVTDSKYLAISAPYNPSLEMRENVDFLLTPALLIQERFSKEVVPSYPNE